jgi:ABC-type transport system involved in multi-copper enzyme maturation permease subunit
MTIIGIGTIFSKEYSSGMDQFLLSSKYGRSKAVTAKILASLIFILSVIIVWSLYSFAMATYSFGMHGWKSSLQ